uniref:P2X purinoceptor n=1 Tax=Molossus molossus TaxID=27622 RepID=A0A7J8ET00_MOLMO|nr:purinergic receptor P2X 3 [Molossus molossus]
MNCMSDFFTYETTKSVVVKSWTIGIINRAVQLLIISYFVGWVFLHEKAYQVRDTAIESSVVTKVKGFGRYANRVMDVSDYVTPPQGTSVFVIITKMIVTENQMQGFCPESEDKYHCVSDSQCGPERFPGGGILTGRCVNYSSVLRTCETQGWCPTEVDTVEMPVMMEAENFTIFIKNSIRFPLFNFEKGNLLPNLTAADMKTCRFHPDKAPFCPILRVGDVVKFAGQDFAKLASTGGVLGIKIGWVCDLDKAWDQCIPKYSFTRLDGVSEKSSISPGYNFRTRTLHLESQTAMTVVISSPVTFRTRTQASLEYHLIDIPNGLERGVAPPPLPLEEEDREEPRSKPSEASPFLPSHPMKGR